MHILAWARLTPHPQTKGLLPPKDDAKMHCIKIALTIFARVDKEEKTGRATKATVRSCCWFTAHVHHHRHRHSS